MNHPSIAAVIVTYNRLELLKGCVLAVQRQSRPPQEIIVIDNGCTDGSGEWLAAQPGLTVIRQKNGGGSGGQFAGFRAACEAGHDWIWCMDDDTEPTPTALERLVEAPPFRNPETGYLGSLVTWTDGTPHYMNSPDPTDQSLWYHTVLKEGCVRVGYCSFVSLLVRREAVDRVGLPIREFFIWYDDVEFTQRIGVFYKGYLVLDSIALHRTKSNLGVPEDEVKESDLRRYCYGIRNRFYLERKSRTLIVKRIAKTGWLFWRQLKMVLRGRASSRILFWALWGIFFFPKIEFPATRRYPP